MDTIIRKAKVALSLLFALVLGCVVLTGALPYLEQEQAYAAPTATFNENAAEFKITANFAYLPENSIDDTKAKSIVVTDTLDNALDATRYLLGAQGRFIACPALIAHHHTRI